MSFVSKKDAFSRYSDKVSYEGGAGVRSNSEIPRSKSKADIAKE